MKPILFNTEMVKAIINGRKTMTRRIVKPQPDERHQSPLGYVTRGIGQTLEGLFGWGRDEYGGTIQYARPPYKRGDVLYVRETWTLGTVTTGEESDGSDSEPFVSQVNLIKTISIKRK